MEVSVPFGLLNQGPMCSWPQLLRVINARFIAKCLDGLNWFKALSVFCSVVTHKICKKKGQDDRQEVFMIGKRKASVASNFKKAHVVPSYRSQTLKRLSLYLTMKNKTIRDH